MFYAVTCVRLRSVPCCVLVVRTVDKDVLTCYNWNDSDCGKVERNVHDTDDDSWHMHSFPVGFKSG